MSKLTCVAAVGELRIGDLNPTLKATKGLKILSILKPAQYGWLKPVPAVGKLDFIRTFSPAVKLTKPSLVNVSTVDTTVWFLAMIRKFCEPDK